jgi:hypothetical protein
MAKDELTGNIATEKMIAYFESQNIDLQLNRFKFGEAYQDASLIFHT